MMLFYPLVLFNKLLFRTLFVSGEVENLITHKKNTNKGHALGINYFIKPQDLQIDQLVKVKRSTYTPPPNFSSQITIYFF